jgi:hypothetical protein
MNHINLEGSIPILAGIYGLLLAYRVVPQKPKDPEKMELWHRKFGKMMKIISPFLIVFGLLLLFRVF